MLPGLPHTMVSGIRGKCPKKNRDGRCLRLSSHPAKSPTRSRPKISPTRGTRMLKLFRLLWVDLKAASSTDIFKAQGSRTTPWVTRSRRRSGRMKCEGDGSMKKFSEDVSTEPRRAAVATGSSQLLHCTVWCSEHNLMGPTQHTDWGGDTEKLGVRPVHYNSDG